MGDTKCAACASDEQGLTAAMSFISALTIAASGGDVVAGVLDLLCTKHRTYLAVAIIQAKADKERILADRSAASGPKH